MRYLQNIYIFFFKTQLLYKFFPKCVDLRFKCNVRVAFSEHCLKNKNFFKFYKRDSSF